MGSLYQTLKEEIILIRYNFFQKIEAEGIFLNSCYEASIILTPKLDKVITRQENYRPVSLMNIDAKMLYKILAHQINQYMKRIIYHNHMGFIPDTQGW